MVEELDAAELEALLLKQVIPEIERSIAAEKGQRLQEESNRILAEEVTQMQTQAEEEYQQVLRALRNQAQRAASVKLIQMQAQLSQMAIFIQQAKRRQRQKQLQDYQQRFLSENFTQQVMSHPFFQHMRQEVTRDIREQFEKRYESEFGRREKELLVKMKQKEDKEFAEIEEGCRVGRDLEVQEMGGRWESGKVELARLRADNNVKIRKIQAEKKQYQEKILKDSVNYQKIIDELQSHLHTLSQIPKQATLSKVPEAQITASYRNYYEQEENNDYIEEPKMPAHIPEKMIESSVSEEEQVEVEEEEIGLEYHPKHHRILDISPSEYAQKMLENRFLTANASTSHYSSHGIHFEETFEQRDLSKYLPTEAESRRRQYRSNFREEYEKQLKRLSGKRSRLSAAAKQIITQNVLRYSQQSKRRSTSIFSAIR